MGKPRELVSRTMRAAVLVDVDRIEVRDVPRDEPAAHEVVVRVEAVGLCGTDLHIVAGHANYNRDELGRPLGRSPSIRRFLDTRSPVLSKRSGRRCLTSRSATAWSSTRDVPA